ncbi:MAG: hypothetical protein LBK95_11790, partial [Bifidobacteriaceae bacterium]|nr:hypothetical protein [Bifidobacteriaceae bacterium]
MADELQERPGPDSPEESPEGSPELETVATEANGEPGAREVHDLGSKPGSDESPESEPEPAEEPEPDVAQQQQGTPETQEAQATLDAQEARVAQEAGKAERAEQAESVPEAPASAAVENPVDDAATPVPASPAPDVRMDERSARSALYQQAFLAPLDLLAER